MIAYLNLSSGAGTAIDFLVTAHRREGAGADTAKHEKLHMGLMRPLDSSEFRELAVMSAYGDPVHWPGLTAPAVDALGAHLQKTADSAKLGAELGVTGKVFRARTVTNTVRVYGISLEQLERLAPVLEGLAAILTDLSSHDHAAPAAMAMAEMLRAAPTEALAGPLQPLVQAFGQRIQDGKSSSKEWVVLRQIITDQILSGQVDAAFRPIKDAL